MDDPEYIGDPIQDLMDFKTKVEDAGLVAHIPPLSLEEQVAIIKRANLESGGYNGGYSYGGPVGVNDCSGSLAGASQGLMQIIPPGFETQYSLLPEKHSASELAEMGENDG